MKKHSLLALLCLLLSYAFAQNTVLVPTTGNVIVSTCNLILKDAGGDNNFIPNSNGSLSICPNNPGERTRLQFTMLNLGGATLRIRNGSTTSSQVIQTITNVNQQTFSNFTSIDVMGCLTIEFVTGSGNTAPGFAATVSCVTPYPPGDLTCAISNIATTPHYAGLPVTMTLTMQNAGGQGPTIPNVVRYYLSTDSVLSINDSLVGSYNMPATLQPGQIFVNSVASFLPKASMPAGNYYLLAVCDADDIIAELSEVNNVTVAGPILVQQGAIDYTVTTLSAPAILYKGYDNTGTFRVDNIGQLTGGNSHTRILLSVDSTADAGDFALDTVQAASIAGGQNVSFTFSTNILPATIAIGNYYILATTDYYNYITESNENNNTIARAVRVIDPFYDFSMRLVTVPDTFNCNYTTTFTAQVIDTSLHPNTIYASVDYFLSHDTVIDVSDILIHSSGQLYFNYQGIASNNPAITLPDFTAAGNYYLIAVVDGENELAEINELNNIAFKPVTVKGISYDITLQNLVSPDTVYADPGVVYTFACSGLWRNLGSSLTGNVEWRTYLSTDTLYDVSDVNLSTSYLSANTFSYPFTRNVTVPASTLPGNYYLIFVVDKDNSYFETNENNNVFVLPLTLLRQTYDLTINGFAQTGFALNVRETSVSTKVIYSNNTNSNYSAYLSLYLSTDSVINAGDSLLHTSLRNYRGYQPDTATISIIVPNVPTGLYNILAIADYGNALAETNEQNNMYIMQVQIAPDTVDLFFTSAKVPNNGLIPLNTTVQFSGRVKDTSVTRSLVYASRVSVYSSADTIWQAGDVLLGSSMLGTILPYATDSFTLDATVTAASSGHGYILFVCDATDSWHESNEANNVTYRAVSIVPPVVNFTMATAFADTAGGVRENDLVTFTGTANNSGNTTIAYSVVRVYRSADTIFSPATDLQLYTYSVTNLQPGANYQLNTTNSIPGPAGNYYILFVADATSTLAEDNETDNVVYIPLTLMPALPSPVDVAVTGIVSGAMPVSIGSAVNHYVSFTNTESVYISMFTCNLYLSADTVKNAGDILIAATQQNALSGLSSATRIVSGLVPANTPAGNYYMLAVADTGNTLNETNEANNTAYVPVEVVGFGADLFHTSQFSNAYNFIRNVSTNYPAIDAGNFGVSGTSAFNAGLYLSTDSFFDIQDLLLKSVQVAAMPVMSHTMVNFTTGVFPQQVTAGNYYLLSVLDHQNQITESNEANNTYVWPAVVNDPYYDINALNVETPDTILYSGGSYYISTDLFNQSNAPTTSFLVGFSLSTDTIVDVNDIYLGGINTMPSINQQSSVGITATIPQQTPPGVYYLLANADRNNVLAETNENNNLAHTIIRIGLGYRDLVMDSLAIDTVLMIGLSKRFTIRVTNAGTIPVSSTSYSVYLSTDSVWSPNDLNLGGNNGGIWPNQMVYYSGSFLINNSYAPGYYYILAATDAQQTVAESNETNNMLVQRVLVIPTVADLGVSAFSLGTANDEFPTDGQQIDFEWQVSNYTNDRLTMPAWSRIVISDDTIPDPADTLVYRHLVNVLYGGANNSPASYTYTYTLPASISPGLHYFIYWLDTANVNNDPNLFNNKRIIPFYVVPSYKDVYPIDLITRNGYMLYNSTNSFKIASNGTGAPGQVRYSVYLSADSVSIANAALYLRANVTMAANSLQTITFNNVSGPTPDVYYFIIVVDDLNQCVETNEANNRLVQVVSRCADGRFAMLPSATSTLPYTLDCGDTIFFSAKPQFTPLVQVSRLSFKMDSYNAIDFSGFSLSGFSRLNVYRGYNVLPTNLIATYDANNAPGMLFPQTDSITFELTTANVNPGAFKCSIKCGVTAPDLSVDTVILASDTLIGGEQYAFGVKLMNTGTSSASSSLAYVVFSTDTIIDGSDIQVLQMSFAALPAGVPSPVNSTSLVLPSALTDGYYYILVTADGPNQVYEMNENNNTYIIPVYYKRYTVGLDEIAHEGNVYGWVNTASRQINLVSSLAGRFAAILYNSVGQKIAEGAGSGNLTFDAVVSGVYIAEVNYNGHTHRIKLLVP
jgi:subtilase family serine protease